MIKSVRLLNWRSHHDSRFEFHQGTNLLVGIMGAGKSAVLEAISFAFFGTFPALERRKLRLEDIIRLNEPFARVILEFGWEGVLYRIERSIERSKKGASSDCALYRDNRLVESGSVAATSYLHNLTGVDYDLFTRAIYSEQNNIDYFLTLEPRKRKQEIDTLLGLDKFEDARANVVTVIGRIRSKKQGMEERMDKTKLAELEQNEKSNAEKVASQKAKLSETNSSFEKNKAQLSSLSAGFEDMRKKKELSERLEKETVRLSAICESLQNETQKLDEKAHEETKSRLSSAVEQRNTLNKSARSLDDAYAKLSKEAGTIEARLKSASEAKTRVDASRKELAALLAGLSIEQLVAEQKDAEKSLLSLDSEKKSFEHELAELSELIEKLKPGITECPLCASKITDVSHIKTEKNAVISKKKARIQELDASLLTLKKKNEDLLSRARKASFISEQVGRLEQEISAVASLESKMKELETQLAKLRDDRSLHSKQLDDLTAKIDKLRADFNEMEGLLKKKKELETAEKRLSESKSQLASIKFDNSSFEALRESIEKAKIENERLVSEKNAAEAQIRLAEDVLKIIRQELALLKKLESDVMELGALEEELLIYKNALLDTQTSLRGSLVDAINSAMNEIWPIFYPYRNYHALRLQVSEKDYLFEVNDGRAWKTLESMASGGERATAALTLRVALAMVLTPRLSWLILDEPTHNLDSDAIDLLSSALQVKVPEVVKQTFVITHEEGLMGSDFASSYRLTRNKEHNGETKIEVI